MRNVQTKLEGSKLTIVIDINAATEASKSGKSDVIASTEGNVKISTPDGERFLGLNFYRKIA